jgi:hypothetical protein
MKTLHFAIDIRASRQTVWNTLLAPDTFRLWTAEFAEGSYYEGSWDEGARIEGTAEPGPPTGAGR